MSDLASFFKTALIFRIHSSNHITKFLKQLSIYQHRALGMETWKVVPTLKGLTGCEIKEKTGQPATKYAYVKCFVG